MSNLSEELRDEGMALARNANDRKDDKWFEETLVAFRQLAETHEFVHADLLRQHVREPWHFNAWGSVWTATKSRGIIDPEPAKWGRSTRPNAHAARMPIYRSRIFKGH